MLPRFAILWAALAWPCLVRAAAPAPDHWAFRPVTDPPVPAGSALHWGRTSIDAFILARLESAGQMPETQADPATLVRRAYFGLTGLPPTAADIEGFRRDPSPAAWAALVNRLLDSPAYGEHWGRHWLDVVRYADTAGETADYPVPTAWRYRNYVIEAFQRDLPYDQFLREQIAGDILARQGSRERYAEQVTATGFLAVSRRFGFDSENYHHLTLQDTIDTVGQSVLGLTLGCARCHSHKYDPVSMREYYSLYGIFESTRYAFPGSEQKQRLRALAPLVPPEESLPAWRDFERRTARLARVVQAAGLPVPTAVLRSIDDLDGDFELQAPAAGGSKGVLVPPWTYEGPIAVTTEAQSPFQHLHPTGRVGASIAAGSVAYRLGQALHPARTADSHPGRVFVNLEFKINTATPTAAGSHRFWLGSASAPAVEMLVSATDLRLRTGSRADRIAEATPGAWQNAQLILDLTAGTVEGTVGNAEHRQSIEPRPLAPGWRGVLDYVGLDGVPAEGESLPALLVDNLGVQTFPLDPVSTELPGLTSGEPGITAQGLRRELTELVGQDGGFEFQTAGLPLSAPWNPGPNSRVELLASAQSPLRRGAAPGVLGVRLAGGESYDGFGLTLTQRWESAGQKHLYGAFEFRTDAAPRQPGTWRFYVGRGPGTSAALEWFIDGNHLHQRNGKTIETAAELAPGEWHEVRYELDLTQRRYQGVLTSAGGRSRAFSGEFAAGWNGVIDYLFLDSYGHRGGPRPALEADNFTLGPNPLPSPASESERDPTDWSARRATVQAVKDRLTTLTRDAESARTELERLLAEGPVPLAYAVSEGTPRDARLQRRGEPDQPGEEVPRGFLEAVGGGSLPAGSGGSGRLALAEWLTHPDHPLTARVMVNRIWQYHFGQGLVPTANDFGRRGQRPSHPELLDHLASGFMARGWSVKEMHRWILGSAVYQQRSRHSSEPAPAVARPVAEECPVESGPSASTAHAPARTPAAETFSPFPRRRLQAEEIRDALLVVSGRLEAGPGRGHPFPAPTTWGFTQHGPYRATYDHAQRSVYLMTQRIQRHPFLALFDGADPNASTAGRRTTTVPTQALFFLNDPFFHASAAALSGRAWSAAEATDGRIRTLYELALGRRPTDEEGAEAAAFVREYSAELGGEGAEKPALEAFARVLLASNEFVTVD